jgi:hypothetical protein
MVACSKFLSLSLEQDLLLDDHRLVRQIVHAGELINLNPNLTWPV